MTDDELRAEVSAWLEANWTEEDREYFKAPMALRGPAPWFRRLLEAGWRVPAWPREWCGRDLSAQQTKIVQREFARVKAPGAADPGIAAGTVFAFGSDELKHRMLAKFLTNEATACLLYSEPNAGSDLASVRTQAERRGDHYIVNGSKIWTSSARIADHGLLLARTNWDAPKHSGISFFILPMHQKGVEVRPLRQITGESQFNEVFFTDAIVPAENIVGEEGAGWKVLQTALAYERQLMGSSEAGSAFAGDPLRMLRAAKAAGKLGDPLIRQNIARIMALKELNALNMRRATEEAALGTSSPIMSLGKLAMSRILHGEARVLTQIAGARSMLTGQSFPVEAAMNHQSLFVFINSIGGGSDQIQRNIISERVLGLPREMEMDRDIPFRESRAVRAVPPR